MKRLFKNLLIPTLVGSVILPITSCSLKEAEKELGTIEIVSDIQNVTVTQYDDHLSSPIEVKCLSHDKQQLGYELKLKLVNNEHNPDWISIVNNNQIQLKGDKKVGSYTFSLTAFNAAEQLYSKEKTFVVNVINQRHIIPTNLSMSTIDDWYYMYGESSTQKLDITPSKEGVEEKYLINDIKCSVEVISGQRTDLQGNALFTCLDAENDHNLVISSNTNSSYCGTYLLRVTATLVANSNLSVSKDIKLNIQNIYEYSDSSSRCTFSRTKDDEGWTVSTFDTSKGNVLYNLPTEIYHRPVNKIAENFCANSQIDRLVQAILPQSIKIIGANAFINQTSLCSIEMPGVRYIGNNAFKNASLLEYRISSTKPKLLFVGDEAFYNCDEFKMDDFSDLIWAGENAFYNTAIQTSIVGEKCQYLGANSFGNCLKLNTFKIYSQNPPILGGNIFYKSDGLSTVQVPVASLADYRADESWKNLGKLIEGI